MVRTSEGMEVPRQVSESERHYITAAKSFVRQPPTFPCILSFDTSPAHPPAPSSSFPPRGGLLLFTLLVHNFWATFTVSLRSFTFSLATPARCFPSTSIFQLQSFKCFDRHSAFPLLAHFSLLSARSLLLSLFLCFPFLSFTPPQLSPSTRSPHLPTSILLLSFSLSSPRSALLPPSHLVISPHGSLFQVRAQKCWRQAVKHSHSSSLCARSTIVNVPSRFS